MNGLLIDAADLGKRYRVLRRQRSTLRALQAWRRHEKLTGELWALRGLSFRIAPGEKVALIGRNGSGKTTLLRVLAGIIEPDAGDLRMAAAPLALFKFWIGQNADLPVIDNIHLFGAVCGLKRADIRPRLPEILETAGIRDMAFAPLHDLSLGQRQRLALSIVFQARSEFLIFDETFVHVDQWFFRECRSFFEALAASPRTMIITSHDRDFLLAHCRRALWLDQGRLRLDGPAKDVLEAYDAGG
jgi:ABC-type polysaccharide/polyol phosphate transport system ATPase subunit